MSSHGRKTKGNSVFEYHESKVDRFCDKAMTVFEWVILIILLGAALYGVNNWLWSLPAYQLCSLAVVLFLIFIGLIVWLRGR